MRITASARLTQTGQEFTEQALSAARLITLELTARFLNDLVVPYFKPGEEHASREAFDYERATLQRSIYARLSGGK